MNTKIRNTRNTTANLAYKKPFATIVKPLVSFVVNYSYPNKLFLQMLHSKLILFYLMDKPFLQSLPRY